jgi:NAD(P)-dependent dehydrogenase (short-subunit alcohol dehydrogenase family)
MMTEKSFEGKQILITGAADGIGKQTAKQLAEAGAKLILTDINIEGLKTMVSELSGENHSVYFLDLSKTEEIETEISRIINIDGPVDGFVHCVGVRSRRPINMLKPAMLTEILNVNFVSFVELIRILSKKGNNTGILSIVGISSISSLRGGPGVTAYSASKGAMDAAVRCLAKELAPKNIRINTVAPGQINTPAFEKLRQMSGENEDPTLSRQYLGLGEPEDVANAIMFLLSNKSRFITGTTLPVDGGFLTT